MKTTRVAKGRAAISVEEATLIFNTRRPTAKHNEYYSLPPIDRVKHVRRIAMPTTRALQLLPQRFSDAIELSRSLLELAVGWDGEDAVPISLQTWTSAVEFLRATIVRSSAGKALPVPQISPCRDGSIDLFWSTGSFRLLINIKPADIGQSDYYGETIDGFSVKGTFDPSRHDLSAVLRLLIAPPTAP